MMMQSKNVPAPETVQRVLSYIQSHWDESVHDDVRNPPPANVSALPVPHTVPCLHGHFPVFFYWDTYFTNVGLIIQGRLDLAKSNCEAMAWLIGRHGFIPNNTFVSDANRSQPPYFSRMVREVYEVSGDKAWLGRMSAFVQREYQFWMTARHSPLELNRHGEHASRDFLLRFYDGLLHNRLGLPLGITEADKIREAGRYLAEAETGWDFNPRFEHRCPDFCPVDLNSLLWGGEKDLAYFFTELVNGDEAARFEALADKRESLMRKYLWSTGRGLYLDFDHTTMRLGKTACLAAFHPLWLGMATADEAARTHKQLSLFEEEYGAAVCERVDSKTFYQWGHPNGWPPLTYTTVMGLHRYGYTKDAARLAEKYIAWAVTQFEKTGQLWEKFNVLDGTIAAGEYEAQPMLGWSAGVFVALARFLDTQNA
ncbi:MAG: alpha,alpha-trehalase [Spirochaetes bacterium]|nr:alpha,alpha-trehalase [Spirochaetota bacterium]